MADTDVINLILSTTSTMLVYLLPVIAVLSGITFIVSWLMSITLGLGKRTFKG